MEDSVQSDRKIPTAQAISPGNMADDSRFAADRCQAVAGFNNQNLDASTPTTQAKLALVSAVAATWGSVGSIAHFTVKAYSPLRR